MKTQLLYESDLLGANYIIPVLSFMAILFAIYTIISKNPILSVLFLIGLFFSISLYLISVGLQFLGLVYLIVYVGAVSILFLFILMLINVRVSELLSDTRNSASLAILTILCFNFCLNDILPFNIYLNNISDIYNLNSLSNFLENTISAHMSFGTLETLRLIFVFFLQTNTLIVASKNWDAIIVNLSHIASIGNILYTNFFVLFMITSLILLLAMVGAIIITVNKPKVNDEWNLTSPPKPHAFVSLPVQSSTLLQFDIHVFNNIFSITKNTVIFLVTTTTLLLAIYAIAFSG